ncbi:MAG: urease accessory protein UreD [Pseudomonadota bacterium]
MLDASPVEMQRSRGAAHVVLARSGPRMALRDLAQSGSAKAFLPRIGGGVPEVVFLNTSGGLTGGDSLSYALDLGPGGSAVATTQTAERAYRSARGVADVQIRLRIGSGGHLDWLPQETILFDGAGLARETRVELAADATFLGIEVLVLGRAAMGERVTRLELTDRREIWRDGNPLQIEPLRLTSATLGGLATTGDAAALATLTLVAPDAEDRLDGLRDHLAGLDLALAASAWDGRLVLRAAAADATPLRRAMARALTHLRGVALPRVWQI